MSIESELTELRRQLEELRNREYSCEDELVRTHKMFLDEISDLTRRVEALERGRK
ncbi:MAG: hypothetical protein HY704_11765 [Gemmatimonadetes bacterium]|nr:hypothetical protein [Gemmatimonadota bacterium]